LGGSLGLAGNPRKDAAKVGKLLKNASKVFLDPLLYIKPRGVHEHLASLGFQKMPAATTTSLNLIRIPKYPLICVFCFGILPKNIRQAVLLRFWSNMNFPVFLALDISRWDPD